METYTATATAIATAARNSSPPIFTLTSSALCGSSKSTSIATTPPSTHPRSAPSLQGQQSLPLKRVADDASTQATLSRPGLSITSTWRRRRYEVSYILNNEIKSQRQGALHRPCHVLMVPHPCGWCPCPLRRNQDVKATWRCRLFPLLLLEPLKLHCLHPRTHRPSKCRSTLRRHFCFNLGGNSRFHLLLPRSDLTKFGRPGGHQRNLCLLRRIP